MHHLVDTKKGEPSLSLIIEIVPLATRRALALNLVAFIDLTGTGNLF